MSHEEILCGCHCLVCLYSGLKCQENTGTHSASVTACIKIVLAEHTGMSDTGLGWANIRTKMGLSNQILRDSFSRKLVTVSFIRIFLRGS